MEKIKINYDGTDKVDTIILTKTDYEKIERLSKAWNMKKLNVIKTAINQEIKILMVL